MGTGFPRPTPTRGQPRGATPLTLCPREFCSTHRDRTRAPTVPGARLRRLLGGREEGARAGGRRERRDPATRHQCESQKGGQWWLGISVSHPAGHACFRSAPQGQEGLVGTRGWFTPPGTPRQSHSCCPSGFSRRARQSLPPGCPLGTCGGRAGRRVSL